MPIKVQALHYNYSMAKRTNNKIIFNPMGEKYELKSRAIKSAGITVFAQVFGFSIQTIGTFWIARLVIPEDFGLVTMVIVFSLLFQNLGENGFSEYVLQKDKINHIQLSTLFWINAGFNTTLAIAFVIFSPVIAWFNNEPRLIEISMVMSLSIILGALSVQHLALMKRNMDFLKTSINEVTSGFLSTIIAVVLAYIGLGYWAIVLRRVTMPLFMAIGGWILCPWVPGAPKKIEEMKSMLRFVFNTYGNFSVSYFSRNLDKILIGKYYGTSSLGFYDRAYHLAMLLPNLLSSSLASVAITTLSKLRDNLDRYKIYYTKMISIIALVSIPLSTILAFTGKDIVVILLGSQWDQAGEIFRAFSPSIGIMVIYATSGWVHLSLGRADRWFKWGLIRMSCATFAIIIGLFWGPRGVAIAYSIYIYATFLPALIYAGNPIGINFMFLVNILWRYLLAGGLSAFFCWVLFYSIPTMADFHDTLSPVLRIIMLSLSCGLSYIVGILLLFKGVSPFLLLSGLMREILNRKKVV